MASLNDYRRMMRWHAPRGHSQPTRRARVAGLAMLGHWYTLLLRRAQQIIARQ